MPDVGEQRAPPTSVSRRASTASTMPTRASCSRDHAPGAVGVGAGRVGPDLQRRAGDEPLEPPAADRADPLGRVRPSRTPAGSGSPGSSTSSALRSTPLVCSSGRSRAAIRAARAEVGSASSSGDRDLAHLGRAVVERLARGAPRRPARGRSRSAREVGARSPAASVSHVDSTSARAAAGSAPRSASAAEHRSFGGRRAQASARRDRPPRSAAPSRCWPSATPGSPRPARRRARPTTRRTAGPRAAAVALRQVEQLGQQVMGRAARRAASAASTQARHQTRHQRRRRRATGGADSSSSCTRAARARCGGRPGRPRRTAASRARTPARRSALPSAAGVEQRRLAARPSATRGPARPGRGGTGRRAVPTSAAAVRSVHHSREVEASHRHQPVVGPHAEQPERSARARRTASLGGHR